jgi:hypothetical protein
MGKEAMIPFLLTPWERRFTIFWFTEYEAKVLIPSANIWKVINLVRGLLFSGVSVVAQVQPSKRARSR